MLYKILMKKYLNKLEYRSWHRGTKEADLFLGKFFDKYKGKIKKENLSHYENFLEISMNGLKTFLKK